MEKKIGKMIFASCVIFGQMAMAQGIIIGTYTNLGNSPGNGIYWINMISRSNFAQPELITNHSNKTPNPSYLLPLKDTLYVVNELENGMLSTYKITPQNTLLLKNKTETKLANPVHLIKSKLTNQIIVANYGNSKGDHSGLSVFQIKPDGQIHLSQTFRYTGSSIDPERQSGSHTHGIASTIINEVEYVFVADLGTDTIYVYKINSHHTSLAYVTQIKTPPGSGPRHIAIHPNKPYLYVANELNSTISIYQFDANSKKLDYIDSVRSYDSSQIPKNRNYPAEIILLTNTKYLYVSNRGKNSIDQFVITDDGKGLQLLEEYAVNGDFPRDLAIDSTATYLVSANQRSNNVSIFKINNKGHLTPIKKFSVPSPVSVKFID